MTGRYTTDERIENGYFLYRDGDYPCGKEFILIPSGTDKKGRRTYTEIEVWDGRLPYNERDWLPIKDAVAPRGYVWYSNNKSRFGRKRETALLRIEARRK